MNNLVIRPVKLTDASAIHALRQIPEVLRESYGLPTDTLAMTETFLKGLTPDDALFVGEWDGVVAGHCGLSRKNDIRLAIHPTYHRQGIGRQMLRHLLRLAEKRNLSRLELVVFAENTAARALYESEGFVIEGIKRSAVIREGRYSDVLVMATVWG